LAGSGASPVPGFMRMRGGFASLLFSGRPLPARVFCLWPSGSADVSSSAWPSGSGSVSAMLEPSSRANSTPTPMTAAKMAAAARNGSTWSLSRSQSGRRSGQKNLPPVFLFPLKPAASAACRIPLGRVPSWFQVVGEVGLQLFSGVVQPGADGVGVAVHDFADLFVRHSLHVVQRDHQPVV
jgi:hypothetical protein